MISALIRIYCGVSIFVCLTMAGCAHADSDFLESWRKEAKFGTCENALNESVNLQSRLTIEERTLQLANFSYTLEGARLLIVGERDDGTSITQSINMEDKLCESLICGANGIDIRTKFLILDGSFYIYWEETFENRPHKQGLLRLTEFVIENHCAGEVGISSIHE